jgi:hypothetical protein
MRTKASYVAAAMALALFLGFGQQNLQSQSELAAAPELEATVFNVANSMGMLRGRDQQDEVATLELWATGTMTVDGQQREITEYRASVNYMLTGLREDLTVTTPAGQTERHIRAVSGNVAWDESELGVNSTPALDTVRERLVQLWTTPMGAAKAVKAAGSAAKLTVENGTTILTFPLPSPVNDVVAKATLSTDPALLILWHDFAYDGAGVGTYITKVETSGGVETETTYAEYGDWNYDDYKEDVFIPRRIVHTRADGTSLDLTVTNTNTTNPYVVVPVPQNVRAAAGATFDGLPIPETIDTGPAPAATPRTPNGKVDLSGMWASTSSRAVVPDADGNIIVVNSSRPCHPGQECKPAVNIERDPALTKRVLPGYNVPAYKPEFWDHVQHLDVNGNMLDTEPYCYPEGLPRMGAPDKIVQTDTEVILLYRRHNTFRVIPIDGRPHDPIRAVDLTWYGEAVGTWEGDTLVIDVVGFTGESWLDWAAYPHTNNMRVVERLRREGDTLIWQITVHDPEMLQKPWVMPTDRRSLNPDPQAVLQEDLPCDERDMVHMVTRERA